MTTGTRALQLSGSRLDTIALPRQRRGDTRPAVLRSTDVTAASLAAAWHVAQADQVPAGIPGLTVRRVAAGSVTAARKRFGALVAPAAVWTVSASVDAVAARHFVSGATSAHSGSFLALALVGLALPLAAGHRLSRGSRGRRGRAQALACVAFAYAGALFAFAILSVVLLDDLAARLTPGPH